MFVGGLVLALAGAALAQWVTGGRSPFVGWSLNDRDRRKRRARINERFPRIGRWLLPAGYVCGLVGVVVLCWAMFSA